MEARDFSRERFTAIVHRDYSFSGSIIINVTDSDMEFISLGGLLSGLSPDDIQSGISQPRNKNLAEVFHRLRLIESYGTGIRRIFKLYAGFPKQPKIEITSNTFKMVLPNRNASFEAETGKPDDITPQMQKVLDLVREKEQISEKEIRNLLGLKKTRTYVLTKQMQDMGILDISGRGENKTYRGK